MVETEQIEIVVNGKPVRVAPGMSVAGLLAALKIEDSRVAVELNREIVRREAWGATLVEVGAEVEIVQFVGGG
jgi:sulfur carrier protein